MKGALMMRLVQFLEEDLRRRVAIVDGDRLLVLGNTDSVYDLAFERSKASSRYDKSSKRHVSAESVPYSDEVIFLPAFDHPVSGRDAWSAAPGLHIERVPRLAIPCIRRTDGHRFDAHVRVGRGRGKARAGGSVPSQSGSTRETGTCSALTTRRFSSLLCRRRRRRSAKSQDATWWIGHEHRDESGLPSGMNFPTM